RGDTASFDDAIARLFPPERKPFARPGDRDDRDRSAVELFELLAARQAARADRAWQRLLEARAEKIGAEVSARHRPEAERIVAALRELRGKTALRGAQAVALGAVPVELDAPLPPPPPVSFDW